MENVLLLSGLVTGNERLKMKIPSLKNNFGSEIIERGYDYHKQGRVKNLIIDGKKAKAVVIGNRDYRVTIDLSNEDFKCTCPCDFNCKHAAAVIYELRENANIETTTDIKNELAKKSRDELIAILQRILVSDTKFKKFLSNKPEDIKKVINSIDVDDYEDMDKLVNDVEDVYDLVMQKGERLNSLVLLFKKCFKIWDDLGGVEPLEDSMFDMLESISKESKKLPKNKRQSLIQELVDLTRDSDFFWDSIDDGGIKINY